MWLRCQLVHSSASVQDNTQVVYSPPVHSCACEYNASWNSTISLECDLWRLSQLPQDNVHIMSGKLLAS